MVIDHTRSRALGLLAGCGRVREVSIRRWTGRFLQRYEMPSVFHAASRGITLSGGRRAAVVLTLGYLACSVSTAWAQIPPIPEQKTGDSHPQPDLHIAQRFQDLGTVLEGDKPIITWHLENRGTADLVIQRTRTTCGCTVVKLTEEQKRIPPGGSLEFKAEFNSKGRRGVQSKFVTVISNDPGEPMLKLEFTAKVVYLFEMIPPGLVNLRTVRRGVVAGRTVEFLPGAGRKKVEILDIQTSANAPLSIRHEPFSTDHGIAERLFITVGEHVALGTLTSKAKIKLSVDGLERERELTIRGEVVSDLTWHPKVVDTTRQPSAPGKRLVPVTVSSIDKKPFDLLEAVSEPYFDVEFAPSGTGRLKKSKYTVLLTVRSDAPPGPFGTTLEIRTGLLDQPLLRIPVFGIVAAPIEVDPPVVLLRQDGTGRGTQRRIKIWVQPQLKLDLSNIRCDNDAVEVVLDREVSSRYQHLRFLIVRLSGTLTQGTHEAVLSMTTNVAGHERIEVPVIIEVPAQR